MRFIMGLDLGQSADYTALCVLEDPTAASGAAAVAATPRRPHGQSLAREIVRPQPLQLARPTVRPAVRPMARLVPQNGSADDATEAQPVYHCRHLQRFQLGTKYPDIVTSVKTMLDTPQLKDNCALVVDASGVGRPVVDMFTQAGLKPVAVTITGGTAAHFDKGMWHVPKRILVSTLQVLLQGQRLQIVDVPERATLIKEMLAFQVTITEAANDTYAGRTGAHDDLVLAVALASWKAMRPKPAPQPRSTSAKRRYYN